MEHPNLQTITRQTTELARRNTRESKLVSTVRKWEGNENDQKTLNAIQNAASNSFIKFVVRHKQHIHIVHDCKLSNGSCRCFKHASARRYTPKALCRELSEEDWRAIFLYHLFDAGREKLYVEIGGTCYEPEFFGGHEDLGSDEYGFAVDSSGGTLETCESENQILRQLGKPRGQGDLHGDKPSNEIYQELLGEQEFSSATKKRKRGDTPQRKVEQEAEDLYAQLIEVCASPITDGDRRKEWCHPLNPFRFKKGLNTANKMAKDALNAYFCNLTLKELRTFYENRTTTPVWGALSKELIYEHYLDRDTSLEFILKLLIFQFCGTGVGYLDPITYEIDFENARWEEAVYTFVRDLIIVLDKHAGKANTIYISSPSGACKTTFFDCIRDYMLCHGNMSNWNRFSQFPCQMLVDKRVGFWNEPNAEKAAFEDLKKVLGGEYYSANVKNRDHVEVCRTPMFLSGNSPNIFGDDRAFDSRIMYYTWKRVPFANLSNTKKLFPMALQDLFDMCERYFETIYIQ